MARYCIFRTDRIGDLILTLPMAEAIKRHDPAASVTFCVQDYTSALARLNPFIDETISIPGRDLSGGDAPFVRVLMDKHFDTAVFAFPRPGLSVAERRAGIPTRVGIAYRWYSMFYTHRRREHRNPSVLHERDYNLNLLKQIGIPVPAGLLPRLDIPPALEQRSSDVLGRSGIPLGAAFAVLHPGSGGSAKDWPVGNMAQLARELTAQRPDLHLLITGTRAERPLMLPVAEAGGERAHVLADDIPLEMLAAVLANSRLCVANSTGPLHIAAAAGAPVLGLYPFERVCHPRRWGPLGDRSAVFTPDAVVGCPACAAGDCTRHDDMRRITTATVLAEALRMLEGA